MVDEERADRPAGPVVGRFVTIVFRDAPSGLAFELLEHDEHRLRLRPLLLTGALPFRGEKVTCRSSAGQWSTTVLSAADGTLELSAPRWLSRPVQRSWRRVPLDQSVTVGVSGRAWAGRLQDVSMKGAAILLERTAAVRAGDRLELEVPGGTIQASVRSVRSHPQRLLVVVGVVYDRIDPVALRWVAAAVGGRSEAGDAAGPGATSAGRRGAGEANGARAPGSPPPPSAR